MEIDVRLQNLLHEIVNHLPIHEKAKGPLHVAINAVDEPEEESHDEVS